MAKSDKSYHPRPSPAPSADMAAVKLQNRLVATEVLIFMDMIYVFRQFHRLRATKFASKDLKIQYVTSATHVTIAKFPVENNPKNTLQVSLNRIQNPHHQVDPGRRRQAVGPSLTPKTAQVKFDPHLTPRGICCPGTAEPSQPPVQLCWELKQPRNKKQRNRTSPGPSSSLEN